jgi:hypothetical protein
LPAIRAIHIARSALLKEFFMGPQTVSLSAAPNRLGRSYFPIWHGIPGRQIGSGSPAAKEVAPNAVPTTTNKNPSIIFAFI